MAMGVKWDGQTQKVELLWALAGMLDYIFPLTNSESFTYISLIPLKVSDTVAFFFELLPSACFRWYII